MALVTFNDSRGVCWSVWNVARPIAEKVSMDYLSGSEYRDGWLCFQPTDSDERRRLADFPKNWTTLPPSELEKLCASAAPVVGSRSSASLRPIDSPRTETGGFPPFGSSEKSTH